MDINAAKDFLENRINPNMVGTVLRAAEEEGEKHALPSGGEVGDILKKTADGAEWAEETKELPSGGNKDDVLTKTESGVEWKAPKKVETFTVSAIDWQDETNIEPFVAKAQKQVSHTVKTNSIVTLVNNNPIAFANCGFVVGSVANGNIEFWTMKKPTETVTLTVMFEG